MIKQLTAMPKYEAYKDSGVEWLGEIPNNWEIKRLKNLAEINPSFTNVNNNDDIACFLPMEMVEINGSVVFDIQKKVKQLRNGFTNFQKNDVIVAKITPCFENGKGACLDKMPTFYGFGSTEFHVLRAKPKVSSKYIYYVTKTHLFMKLGECLMTGSAGQKRVPSDFLFEFYLAYPPFPEQIAIAAFLDRKTAQIDQAVTIKEKQITLLKERKQILIQNAVTRGLNPDAPMRDSGVEWVGEIPEHWAVLANRVLFRERVEPAEDGLPLLSVSIHTAVSSEEISEDENIRGRIKIEDKTKYNLVQPGDLVFNMMRAWQGAIGAVKVKGMVSPAYIIATPNEKIISSYFEYQYRCPEFIQQMDRYSKGITDFRKRLYWGEFKQLATIVPPVEEQTAIVAHIETESAKIDKAIAIQQQQIDKLKEYKATLINSAVTGKIKIPELVEAKVATS